MNKPDITRGFLRLATALTAATGAFGGTYLATHKDTSEIAFPHEGEEFLLEGLTLREKLAQIYHGSSYNTSFADRLDRGLNHQKITSRPGLISFTDWLTDWLKSNETIGGVHIFRSDARSVDEAHRTAVELMANSKIPPLITMDIVGGYTRHLGITAKDAAEYGVPAEFLELAKRDGGLELPTQESLGMIFNTLKRKKDYAGQMAFRKRMEVYGAAIGKICRDIGVVVNFSPVLDMVDDVNGTQFMAKNDETYGSDLHTIMALGFHYMKGFQSVPGVMVAPKHFVGTGKMPANPHSEEDPGMSTMTRKDGTILPFRDAISGKLFHDPISTGYPQDRETRRLRNEGDPTATALTTMPPVNGIMVGHAQNFLNPETPGTLSPEIIQGKLRGALGFTGIAWTDDMSMGVIDFYVKNTDGAMHNAPTEERYVRALSLGITMPMMLHSTKSLDDITASVQRAIDSKQDLDGDGNPDLTIDMINARVQLVLDTKVKLGLLSAKTELYVVGGDNPHVAERRLYVNTAKAYMSGTRAFRK